MKIGFDGKRAVSNMTGLGNYSRLVIEQMAAAYPCDSFNIYTPKLTDNPRLEDIRKFHNVSFHLPPQMGFHGSIWRTFGIPNNLRADGVEVFHGLSNELPLNIKSAHIPSVVTIHDVIYRRLPYCYKPIDRLIYDYKYGASCRNADRIIAISECTKKDVMEFYGVPESKIDVIYQGCDGIFKKRWSQDRITELKRKWNLPEKYLLQVGTVEKRKNLELSVRALSATDGDMPLVAVGRDHYGYKDYIKKLADELGVAHRLIFIDRIPFEELPGLNQGAEIILYPSRYEGFGLPVIEGLESSRPVIAATGSCLEEAGGVSSIYVDPDSPREMADAINSILSGERDVEKMIGDGLKHATGFDTSKMAYSIKETYIKAIKEFKG